MARFNPFTSADLTDLPAPLKATVLASRRMVRQHAFMAAGVAVVPVPGLDWAADVGVLVRLIPRINHAFGLSPDQIERLAPERRMAVYKAITAGGGMLVGKVVTQALVLRLLSMVGLRLSAQQVSKFVPLAGQAVSAVLTYSALKMVCEHHIQQCVAVRQQLALPAPSA